MYEFLKDGGFKSRKLILTIGTMVLMFAGAILAASCPSFSPEYPTLVGGLVACLTAFCGANVSNNFLMGKHVVAMNAQKATEPPVEPEPEGP